MVSEGTDKTDETGLGFPETATVGTAETAKTLQPAILLDFAVSSWPLPVVAALDRDAQLLTFNLPDLRIDVVVRGRSASCVATINTLYMAVLFQDV